MRNKSWLKSSHLLTKHRRCVLQVREGLRAKWIKFYRPVLPSSLFLPFTFFWYWFFSRWYFYVFVCVLVCGLCTCVYRCVHMCMGVYMCVWVCTCVYGMYICAPGQRLIPGIFLDHAPPGILKCFFTAPGAFPDCTDMLESSIPFSPSVGTAGTCCHVCCRHHCWRLILRASCLSRRHFYWQSHSQTPYTFWRSKNIWPTLKTYI